MSGTGGETPQHGRHGHHHHHSHSHSSSGSRHEHGHHHHLHGSRSGGGGHRRSVKDTASSSSKTTEEEKAFIRSYAQRILQSSLVPILPGEVQQDTSPVVMVTGLSGVINMNELINFLLLKIGHPVQVSDFKLLHSKCFFSVPSQLDAEAFKALSPVTFKSLKLTISVLSNTLKQQNRLRSYKLESTFTDFIKHCLSTNPKLKVLDLSGIEEKIGSKLLIFSPNTFEILFKVIWHFIPLIETISLSANNINSLVGFSMARHLKDLKNLCLSDNSLSEFSDLDNLKVIRARELDFRRNPICNSPQYRHEVERRFISLRFLDGQRVASVRTFSVAAISDLTVPPLTLQYSDSDSTHQTAGQFLTKYIHLFDVNRAALLFAYSEAATFSYSVHDCSRSMNKRKRSVPPELVSGNRNLETPHNPDAQATITYGRDLVHQAIQKLPSTKHNLTGCTHDAYVLSSVTTTPILCIHLYGTVEICSSSFPFTRTFLLVPNTSGISQDEWPAVITTDQLQINTTHSALSLTEPLRVSEPLANTSSASNTSPVSIEQANDLTRRLMQDTKLQEKYAVQCLQSADWDYNLALTNFKVLNDQGGIPPFAFL